MKFLPHAFSYLAVLGVVVVFVAGRGASAQDGGVRSYVDPDKLYSMSLPAGLVRGRPERYRGGKAPGLVMRSDDGYVLSVETRQLNMPGGEMAVLDQLERLYMGPGKAWRKRTGVKAIQLGGVAGVRAAYVGPETSGMVAVARGRTTDFLIMFFTPTALRDRLAPQFDWLIAHFDIAQSERRGEGSPLVRAPVFKAPGVFRHERLGYTLRYPNDWRAAYEPPFSAVFTPPAAPGVRVRIQNVSGPAPGVLETWKSDLSAAADAVTFRDARPLVVQTPSGTRVGLSAFAGYTHQGTPYRQWAAVLPRDDGPTVHFWRFDAPVSVFDDYLVQADTMLRSLVMESEQP